MASVVSLKLPLYLVGHHFHYCRFARRGTLRYRLSTTAVTESAESTSSDRAIAEGTAAAALAPTANGALGDIIRHGQGDAYITLSVGGTKFHTLRSTVNSNPVLADHVARVEMAAAASNHSNNKLLHDGAVFIDRDPKNFAFILSYLRNQLDAGSSSSLQNNNNVYASTRQLKKKILAATSVYSPGSTSPKQVTASLNLPKDSNALMELHQEAAYYQIPELEAALCNQSAFITILRFLSGGSGANPFATASQVLSRLRTSLIAFGSVGTIVLGTNEDARQSIRSLGLLSGGQEDGKGASTKK